MTKLGYKLNKMKWAIRYKLWKIMCSMGFHDWTRWEGNWAAGGWEYRHCKNCGYQAFKR